MANIYETNKGAWGITYHVPLLRLLRNCEATKAQATKAIEVIEEAWSKLLHIASITSTAEFAEGTKEV